MEVMPPRQGSVPAGYKQTAVGIIPEQWDVNRLEELGTWKGGMTPSMKNPIFWLNGNVPWISSGDVKSILLKETGYSITTTAVKQGATTLLPAKAIVVVTRSGILRKYLPVAMNVIPMAINQDIKALIPAEKYYSTFLLHALIGNGPRILSRCLKAGTTVESVEFGWLKAFTVPVPPPPEQRAIAEALSDAGALIESLEQLVAKKRQLKQGAMQELLTGKKRLPGFKQKPGYKQTEVGLIPEDWRIQPIEQISTVGRGRVINHREIARSLNPQYPVYSSQTSNNGVMGYLDTFEFEGEYITWTTDGANAGTVFARSGKFNCTNVCGTIKLNSDNHLLVAKVLGQIAPRHVSRHLGNPKLMNDVMKQVKIPLPPTKAEQEAIAAILTDMDTEIAALEAKLAKARQLKQGMMQELLTGRIRLVGPSGKREGLAC